MLRAVRRVRAAPSECADGGTADLNGFGNRRAVVVQARRSSTGSKVDIRVTSASTDVKAAMAQTPRRSLAPHGRCSEQGRRRWIKRRTMKL
jgi:hypothetical protein